jgi:hypothetical protein
LFLPIVVVVILVVLVTTIIMSVISSVVALVIVAIIAAITPMVVTSAVAVIATVVVAAVVAAIIMSIPVIVARIGPAITVISSIRSTVMVVEVLATVLIVVVVAPGPLGGRRAKGALQLLALPHGVFSVTVKLALVVHNHVEVTFEEGGRSWWIRHISFAGSLARPGASVIVGFSVEVVHHRILSVDQFIDVGHEVTNGVRVSFMNLIEYLDVGDPLLVVGNDVFVFDTCKGVAVLEVAVGVLS